MLLTIITIVHIVTCAFLICIVLLQQGKGADMGATFGGGSNTLFGASGADNLLTRVTTVTAFVFMCTSVFLSSSARPSVGRAGNLFQNIPQKEEPVAPLTVPENTTGAPAKAPEETTGAPAAAPAAAPANTAPAAQPVPNPASGAPADTTPPAAPGSGK